MLTCGLKREMQLCETIVKVCEYDAGGFIRMNNLPIKLSIIIVNYNTLELLKHCLSKLLEMKLDLPVEVIIVDNCSRDGSREWLTQIGSQKIRVLALSENRGFAGGSNAGIRISIGEYVLLLNTDAFPTAGALMTLVTYLEQHPRVGIVGPQLLYENGDWQPSTGLYPSPKSAFLGAVGLVSLKHFFQKISWPITGKWWRPCSVEYVDGACMLIRRTVIDEIGLLDERFFFFVEDAEFCYRASEHGWLTHYIPQSQVVHLRGGSSSQNNLDKYALLQFSSRKIFIKRVYGARGWKRFVFFVTFNFGVRYRICSFLAENSLMCEKYGFLKEIYKAEHVASGAM